MNQAQLEKKLQWLLSIATENEVIEFKQAKNQFDFDKLGKYFSALSNEANIKNKEFAWLVLGVNDKHYKQMIIDYLKNFQSASRQEIETLLLDSLPQILTEKQKQKKITNLLYALSSKEDLIENNSKSNKFSSWVIKNKVEA